MEKLLSISNLCKNFGAVVVADQIELKVSSGEALGILGPNGAGKTSLFNMISGTTKPDSGRIEFMGEDITATNPSTRCRMGIARSFQIPRPFSGMTVFENVLVGAQQGARLPEKEAYSHALDVLNNTKLIAKANTRAGLLTLLDRKRLELARALSAKPKLLLLDEIAGGLTEDECHELIHTIKHLHSGGATIIWIEHVVHALLSVVKRLVVIDFGKKIAEGDPQETIESDLIKKIYLGVDPNA